MAHEEAFRCALDAWRPGTDLTAVRRLVREFIGGRGGRPRELAAEQSSGRPTIHRARHGSGSSLAPDDLRRAFEAAVSNDDAELFELLLHPANAPSAMAFMRGSAWRTCRSIQFVIKVSAPSMLRIMLDFLERLRDEDDARGAWTNVELGFPMAVSVGAVHNVRMLLARGARGCMRWRGADGGAAL